MPEFFYMLSLYLRQRDKKFKTSEASSSLKNESMPLSNQYSYTLQAR